MANAVRVRVELKKKHGDLQKNMNDLKKEFRTRVNQSGIQHIFREHQYYESKSEKDRKKRNETVKKYQMETIEQKLLAGEKINASPGLVKKVMANIKKEEEKEKEKEKEKNEKKQYYKDQDEY